MDTTQSTTARRSRSLEFILIVALGAILKAALDQVFWRYSGPVSLAIMLGVIIVYLQKTGRPLSEIGFVRLNLRQGLLILVPQTLLAFLAIMVSGLAVGLGGEALGLDFMKPDPQGAQARFGDIEGNTRLYLTWIAIVWFAGPAEEIYFRGYMVGQLREIFGSARSATILAVAIPALIFGAGHIYYLGLRGFFMTGAIGIACGILYLLYKRNIWPLAVAHALFNSLTFTAAYLHLDV